MVVPCTVWAVVGAKLLGIPQSKPIHGFSPTFKNICLPQEDQELIKFLGVSGNKWCYHGNTFKIFESYSL